MLTDFGCGVSYILQSRGPRLPVAEPAGCQEQRNQRDREKQGTALVVDPTVDHVRSNVNAEQPENQNPEGIAENPQWNHHRHQQSPVP